MALQKGVITQARIFDDSKTKEKKIYIKVDYGNGKELKWVKSVNEAKEDLKEKFGLDVNELEKLHYLPVEVDDLPIVV